MFHNLILKQKVGVANPFRVGYSNFFSGRFATAPALSEKQSMDDNPPLKKIALDHMDGEPVWVVSYDHDGRWGVVDISDQSVAFFESNEIKKEYWFDGRYIFRYKKEIIDYAPVLEKHGIPDEE